MRATSDAPAGATVSDHGLRNRRAAGTGRQQERLTFAPLAGGRVRQLWEQSQDDGRSWTVAFDGTYVPRSDLPTVEPAPD